ncbi:hypothetical protein JXJ21_22745 [candidate division KSB1 bacterium]|nr:hypothetical protein [candidate division KSB1 bacterium]
MLKNKIYDSERAILRDPRSGLRIIRLSHGPCISMNMYFEMCSFTDDDSYVLFLSQRWAGRDAPFDLFRARTDGMELVQITEYDDLSGIVVSPVTNRVFYFTGGDVRSCDIFSLKEETLARAPGSLPTRQGSLASVDLKGEQYFASCLDSKGVASLFRVRVPGGKVDTLYQSQMQGHIHVNPPGDTLYFCDYKKSGGNNYLIDTDGKNIRRYPFEQFAHHSWLGETGKMQGTLLPPGHALVTYKEGDASPEALTEGRYYWHSGASRDAQWIVSDTNWPQEGIFLLHIPSKTVSYVCNPRSVPSHPQWTHPHPSLSSRLKFVLFNSDMTGVGQVYLAELSDEFLAQAQSGYECRGEFL